MEFRYSLSKNGLQLLQQFLGLTSQPPDSRLPDDIIFVAIDFEYCQNIKHDPSQNLNSQVGIAVLDSRHLISSPPRKAISTYNFATGSPSYCAATAKKYLFGETVAINQREIPSRLESLIPRTRNIVLVGHAFWNEWKVLRRFNFDLQTSVVGILDTDQIASTMSQWGSMRLGSLLSDLDCPFQHLHTAGNDAYFTLRALLMLAIRGCPDEVIDDDRHQDKLTALMAITQVYIPRRADYQAKCIKKKRKRMEKNRRHQSKSRDLDCQEHIRAERAARRAERENDLGIWGSLDLVEVNP